MSKSRILLALQNKLTCRQNEAKVKRVKKAIEVAFANAEEKKACAEDRLEDILQRFNADTDVQVFIKEVSKALYDQDEAEAAIDQLKRINDYLFEELDVAAIPDEQE